MDSLPNSEALLHFIRMFREFSTLRKEDSFCDTIITVKKSKFPVHRLLLASVSGYFKKLLDSLPVEIELEDVSEVAVETCINYVYNGTVTLDLEHLDEVIYAADAFELEEMKKLCFKNLESKLTCKNIFEYLKLAFKYGCGEFQQKVENFISTNGSSVLQECNMYDIDEVMMDIFLSIDNIPGVKEEDLCQFLFKWIENDESERKKYFCNLFKLIRLPVTSTNYLCDIVIRNALVKEQPSCAEYAMQSMAFKLATRIENNLTPTQKIDRCRRLDRLHVCTATEILVFQVSSFLIQTKSIQLSESSSDLLKTFNPFKILPTNKLFDDVAYSIHGPDLKILRYSTANDGNDSTNEICGNYANKMTDYTIVTYENQFIYLIGGSNDPNTNVAKLDLLKFSNESDILRDEWVKVEELHVPRTKCTAIVVGENLYVIGGKGQNLSTPPFKKKVDKIEYLTCVEKMNIKTGKWSLAPPLINGRTEAVAKSLKQTIYVIGGDVDNTMEFCNVENGIWTLIKSGFNHPRVNYGAFIAFGKLFVVGGNEGTNELEEWDVEERRWKISSTIISDAKIGKCSVRSEMALK